MKKYNLEEIFGISRDLPLNYVARPHVDQQLSDSLLKKQHIVIHGSSKQGKTCLRKRCLNPDTYITIHCSNKMDIEALNQLILKSAGFHLVTSETKAISGRTKVKASIGFNFLIKGNVEPEFEGDYTKTTQVSALELDLADTNDVIDSLERIQFNKHIVLDDFHYLKPQTQKDFAFALKIFYERSSYCFIVSGVWMEENRLIALSGDLSGRIQSINADKWNREDLIAVIEKGQTLLNITFGNELVEEILDFCFDNVYIVQEICYRICRLYKISATLPDTFYIGNHFFGEMMISGSAVPVKAIVKEIIDQHTGRYRSFLMQFSDGLQNSDIETYKWLLYPILSVELDELATGLRFNRIKDLIRGRHQNGHRLNSQKLELALQSLSALQIEKNITPSIIDYDQTLLRLNVVDKGFLIWLYFQDKEDLMTLATFE